MPQIHYENTIASAGFFERILPTLLAWVAGKQRERVENLQWSSESWTHNIFRLWELVFWRKRGIRPEMSAHARKDEYGLHITYAIHTFEAACALAEQYIRAFLKKFELAPFRIYVPVMRTPQGFPVFTSPYLFAIAHDASGNSGNNEAASPWSFSFTNTGSDLTDVMTTFWWTNNDSNTINTPTYNSVSLTASSLGNVACTASTVNYRLSQHYLVSPATGAHTASVSFSAGSYGEMGITSFTGTNTASIIDNTAGAYFATPALSKTTSITTNYANSFIIDGIGFGGGVVPTLASSQTTEWTDTVRTSGSSRKATTTVGSYSMVWTWSVSSTDGGTSLMAIREIPTGTNYTSTLTETITDTATLIKSNSRTLSETITDTASMIRSVVRTLSETITDTATFLGIKIQSASFTDIVVNLDTIVRLETRAFIETITNTDTIIHLLTTMRTLTETITNTDTIINVHVFVREMALEVVTFYANIMIQLNGIVTNFWTKVARGSDNDDDWTKTPQN